VTYLSLGAAYVFILLGTQQLGLSPVSSAIGLITASAFSSPSFAYVNPLLTDAFGLLAIAGMLYGYVLDRFWLSMVFGIVGVFAREPTLVIFTIWVVRRPAATVACMCLTAALLVLEHRLLESGKPDDTVIPLMVGVAYMRLTDWAAFARDIAATWGWCFLFAPVGFLLLRDQLRRVMVPIIATTVCAVATTFVATDVGRMFAVLLPVFATGCAAVVRELLDGRRWVVLGVLFVMVFVQFFVSWPNRWVDAGTWSAIVPRLPILKVGALWVVVVVIALRDRLIDASRQIGDTLRNGRRTRGVQRA